MLVYPCQYGKMTSLLILSLVCMWFGTAQGCLGSRSSTDEMTTVKPTPAVTTQPPKKCASLAGDANFDLNKFSGEWYGVLTSSESTASSIKCDRVQIGALKDGLLFFQTSFSDKGEEQAVVVSKFKEDCVLPYKFQPYRADTCGYSSAMPTLQTIITDYDSYALIYSCFMQDGLPNERGVLLSRTATLSDDVKNKALSGTNLQLYPIAQTACNC